MALTKKQKEEKEAAKKKQQQEDSLGQVKVDKVIEDPEYYTKLGMSDLQQVVRIMAMKLREVELQKGLLEEMKKDQAETNARMSNVEKELKIMNERNAAADAKSDEAEREAHERLFRVEKRDLAPNLVIRNLMGEGETKEEAVEKIREIIEIMGVTDEVRVRNAVRFRRSKNSNKAKPTIVRVVLDDAGMKPIFFKNINRLKGTPWQRISVANEYPACVREQVKDLDFEGMLYRKAHPGAKTKIDFKGAEPKLAYRLPEWKVGEWDVPNPDEIADLKREREITNSNRRRNDGDEDDVSGAGAVVKAGRSGAEGSRATRAAGKPKPAAETKDSESDSSFHEASDKPKH